MEKKIRVLIVDDEELARIGLRMMLAKFPTIDIVGEAHNIESATTAVFKYNPDVVFLDIEFPGESGFDLLEKIDSTVKIVFVTAFDEFALRAFEINACDYLLKPVNPKRLEVTLKRLGSNEAPAGQKIPIFNYDDQIFLTVNYKYHFLKVESIMRIFSAGKYSEILTTQKIKGLVKKSMLKWEECLPHKNFIRIHRSTIINIELVDKIIKENYTSYRVYLKGSDEKYFISRRYASKIMKLISVQ